MTKRTSNIQLGTQLFAVAAVSMRFLISAVFKTVLISLFSGRIDHYQTPSTVHVSVFAKQVDKEKSTVRIEESQVCHTVLRRSFSPVLNPSIGTSGLIYARL